MKKDKQQSRMKDAMKPENHAEGVNIIIDSPKAYREIEVWVGVDNYGFKCCSLIEMEEQRLGQDYNGYSINSSRISPRLIPEEAFQGLTSTSDGQRKIKVGVSIID